MPVCLLKLTCFEHTLLLAYGPEIDEQGPADFAQVLHFLRSGGHDRACTECESDIGRLVDHNIVGDLKARAAKDPVWRNNATVAVLT